MTGLHHIPLVAAIEIRPPSPDARGTFEREQIERLGAVVAEDLAAVVGEVTRGRLIVGPALLEPAQVINPEFAPFPALERLAALRPGFEPGVTSIGLHRGRAPGEALALVGLDEAHAEDSSGVLTLRALRQTAVMLESCLLRRWPVAAKRWDWAQWSRYGLDTEPSAMARYLCDCRPRIARAPVAE